jgi:hypothetical protein
MFVEATSFDGELEISDNLCVVSSVEEFDRGSKFGAGRIHILHLNFIELSVKLVEIREKS